MKKNLLVILVLFVSLVALRLYLNKVSEGFEGAGKEVVICKADWCGHCKNLEPEYEKVAKSFEGILNIAAVDMDANPVILKFK